jgi:predicted RND superfamily exporter protein
VADVRIAGTAVINGELNRAARRDMLLFFPLVALFVALLGVAIFRNARDTAVLLSVALGTVGITQGLLIAAGYALNMITIMLPTVLIALSVADAIHLIHAFHGARAAAPTSAAAATRAVCAVAGPCAGTSLTTMAGFLAFAGSSVRPVFQLAVFGAIGIAMAWVLTVTVAPVLLTLFWRGARRRPTAKFGERAVDAWWGVVDRHPRWIVAAFAVAVVPLLGLASLRADTDYVKFFRSDTRVPRDYAVLKHEGFPQNPLNLVFRVPEGASPLQPEYLGPLRTLAADLATLPGVQAVLSPFALEAAPHALGDQVATLGGMRSERGDQLQLVVMMDHPSSQELFTLLPAIRAMAEDVLPNDVQLTPTGTSLLWANMDDGVIRTQRQSLAVVSVVCTAILAVLFRSVALAGLGLAVSLFPVAAVLGLMGWMGIPVNLATVLIAGIAVGLAVDDTIHMVHAFQGERWRGRDRRRATEAALHAVTPRLVMTSCILVGSFGVMGVSDFMPTAQFGLLSSLTIVLALAADAALLPVVLAWRRAGRSAAAAPAPALPFAHGVRRSS